MLLLGQGALAQGVKDDSPQAENSNPAVANSNIEGSNMAKKKKKAKKAKT
jgi:hypothetical protein